MKKDKIIVSSADSKYFFLLKELFLSLDKSGILSDYQFSILDTGLTEEQRIFFFRSLCNNKRSNLEHICSKV